MADTIIGDLLRVAYESGSGSRMHMLFDSGAEFLAFLDRVHKLAGGRGPGFEAYAYGMPDPKPSGWFTHARLISQVASDMRTVHLTQRELVPQFAYLQAGFLNDNEYTPGPEDLGWSKLRQVPEAFLNEVFKGYSVAPVILLKAVKFFTEGVSADYARHIAGGIGERCEHDRLGFSGVSARAWGEVSIKELHDHGVPWTYANSFVYNDERIAQAVDVIAFYDNGVTPEYAVAGKAILLSTERIINGWRNGIPIEYLTA